LAQARADEAPIIVTGEKTLRLYEDTAASVSVLTDEDLKERPGLATLDEVLSQLPNVLATGTGNFAPQIRGSDTTGPAMESPLLSPEPGRVRPCRSTAGR
jgi:outer membrane receptor for ferrienterochelin and colicin